MARLSLMMMMMVVMVMVRVDAQRGICTTKRGVAGVCGPLRSCPSLTAILSSIQETRDTTLISTLREAVCGFENGGPLLCCTDFSQPQTPPPTRPPSPSPSPQLPTRCGVTALTDRIIDGEDAKLLAWPWMVILEGMLGDRRVFFCGGVLITQRYVLTAAHCFKPGTGVRFLHARIGEHTLSSRPFDCEKGLCAPEPQDIPAQVIPHPQYGQVRNCAECHDIALLKLNRDAPLHPLHVVPICLPVNPLEQMGYSVQQFIGKYAWAAGWGSTSRDAFINQPADTLQQVLLPIQELQYCDILRRNYPDKNMVLCAGGDGRDTCRGDSGGPIVLSNNVDTKRYVVGITSLGPQRCGSNNTQGLYTNVHHYMEWILNTIRS